MIKKEMRARLIQEKKNQRRKKKKPRQTRKVKFQMTQFRSHLQKKKHLKLLAKSRKKNQKRKKKRNNMVIFNTAWKHVRISPYQALAAIFILIQTFFVISLFTFVIFGSTRVISYFESQPRVSAFFKEEITREDALVLEEEVNATGKIAESKYVSKEEALQIYQNIFKDDPLLLEFVTSDILPASLEVSTYEIEDLASISEILRKSP